MIAPAGATCGRGDDISQVTESRGVVSHSDVARPMGPADDALDRLAALGPDVAVCCLYRSATHVAVPDVLARRLPGARWVQTDRHPLSLIEPADHQRAHRAWLHACQGHERVGRCTLRVVEDLAEAGGVVVAPTGRYTATLVDLIGVDGLDVVVFAFTAPDHALMEDRRDPDEATDEAMSSGFLAATHFRLRVAREGTVSGGTMNVAEVLGTPLVDLLGRHCLSMVHPEDWQQAEEAWNEVLDADGNAVHSRSRLRVADGSWHWFDATSWNVLDVPQLASVITDFRDVNDLVESELARAKTAQEHSRLLSVFDEIDEMVLVVKLGVGVIYANRAGRSIFEQDPIGHLLVDHVNADVRAFIMREVLPALEEMKRWQGDLEAMINGEARTLALTATPVGWAPFGGLLEPDGEGIHVGIIMRDVTAERNHARELDRHARRDSLTGLPNRLALMEHLARLAGAGDPEGEISVCFVDLDNLKVVNDGLGHRSGDRLLQATSAAILETAPPFVARFGGDEFVTVAVDKSAQDATADAQQILAALARVHIEGVVSQVTASVGVAACRRADLDPERLLGDADVAMYAAKHQGRARVAVFDAALRATATRRFELGNGLRHALEAQALEIALQPIFALETGELAGLETLARWPLAEPSEFIPVAEDVGLIGVLGKWVLESGLDALVALDDAGRAGPGVSVSVNVAAGQLLDPSFPDTVFQAVAERGITPSRLVLELTETALIDPRSDTAHVLESLHAAGIRLALDDFGSGYSSLAYLRRYPIDILKLDNTYTHSLITDEETRVITESVVAMAARLGLQVVAEGVETQEQLVSLLALGIHCGQGYLLGRPVSLASILATEPDKLTWGV